MKKSRASLKRIAAAALCAILAAALFGCAAAETDAQSSEAPTTQINPVPETESSDKVSVNLYFGYKTEQLLVYETRETAVPINERIEITICKNLIKGASIAKADFASVINPDTKVVDVTDDSGFLFLTLSKEFLLPPKDMEDSAMKENVRRYLAAYSLINTLTEYCGYERVQILIDRDDSGYGTPITNAEVGLDGDETFDPHGRNGSIILNSRNTIKEILACVEAKDWSRLYGFIAYKNQEGQERPTIDEFKTNMSSAKMSVSEAEIVDHISSTSLYTDKVFTDFTIKIGDGEAQTRTNVPFSLVRENDVWKIYYDSLIEVLLGNE